MDAEEQLRELRKPQQHDHRKVVKHKILSLVMLAIAALCSVYAYEQRLEADAQRGEVINLYREIKRLKEESEATRMEASKLRTVIDLERQNGEAALQQLQQKKK